MTKLSDEEVQNAINDIKKRLLALEKDRDLKLGEIAKRIEAREIASIVDSLN